MTSSRIEVPTESLARVVEMRDDSDGAIMDAISHTYTGQRFPVRGPGVCVLRDRGGAVGGADLPVEHRPG